MSRADSRPLLPSIRCPTAVICGRDDALMPLAIHEELAQGIPGATLAVIDGCGHLAPLERPAEVAGASGLARASALIDGSTAIIRGFA